jgi:hypothetical protein
MKEKQAKTGDNKPARDEKGRLLPGNTANPNGRPPGSLSLVSILKDYLLEVPEGEKKTRAREFIEKNYQDAMSGDQTSKKAVWQYIEGLPKQPIDANIDMRFIIREDVQESKEEIKED